MHASDLIVLEAWCFFQKHRILCDVCMLFKMPPIFAKEENGYRARKSASHTENPERRKIK